MAVVTKAQGVELIEQYRQDLRRLGVSRCGFVWLVWLGADDAGE